MTSAPTFRTHLVKNEFVLERWDEVSALLSRSFQRAAFSEGFAEERPARHTWEEMHKPGGSELGHVVALGSDDRILAAVFCVPIERPENRTTCDVGWVATDPTMPAAEKTRLADAVVARTHEELARAGYEAVVTEMGTGEGAVYLSRRHGYVPAPTIEQPNRWIRALRTVAEHEVSRNSEKRVWEHESGQLARYATLAIAKDDVIIDLLPLLQRARRASVDTLQLSEDYHYRSSVGMPCMNHACSPNGYIRFEDLTYRALRHVAVGEELTFNYCATEYEVTQPFECLCGSPHCIGRVCGFKYLDEAQVERILPLLSPFLKSRL